MKIIAVLLLYPFLVFSQNLVPNPSFENYSLCPYTYGQVNYAVPWIDPTNASSDYFNSCTGTSQIQIPKNNAGFQFARTGNAYLGFNVYVKTAFNIREYVQVQLLDTLKQGVVYQVSFYVNLANRAKYAIDEIGAYFSDTIVTCLLSPFSCVLNFNPQVSNPFGNFLTDTLNWMKINGSFAAVGGEQYLTIGNFKNDSATNNLIVDSAALAASYYYLDDVSVYPDSITSAKELRVNSYEFKVFPNPNNGKFSLEFDAFEKDALMEIKNVLGQIVYSEKFKNISGKQSKTIDLSILPNGVYFITFQSNTKTISKKFVKE